MKDLRCMDTEFLSTERIINTDACKNRIRIKGDHKNIAYCLLCSGKHPEIRDCNVNILLVFCTIFKRNLSRIVFHFLFRIFVWKSFYVRITQEGITVLNVIQCKSQQLVYIIVDTLALKNNALIILQRLNGSVKLI